MRYGKLKAGLALAAAVVGMVGVAIQPAFADYAPNSKDVVGVGSDTLQYLVDFAADGDQDGDPGYNSSGNKYKLINFDATADANARLAYGNAGVGTGSCPPGTGATAGTGNQTTTHSDQPCTLNPTIVIRAGVQPIQRPNGSGAGAKALADDTSHYITFARASSCEGPTCASGAGPLSSSFDSIDVGTDPLAMLAATSTNAVALSAEQLKAIYSCTDTTWTQVGGTSTDTIIPIIPQLGSGTRTTFLADIGLTTVGSCVVTGEENDPTAIAAQSNPKDAIEPMSGGRLNLFLGLLSTGAPSALGYGYFRDPSCPLQDINAGSPSTCANPAGNPPVVPGSNVISPAVKLITTGTPSDSNPLFDVSRPLYIYFRDSDVTSTAGWQPGSSENAVRVLFYNPCLTGMTGCVTEAGAAGTATFGPGGPPWFDQTAAWTDISAAGITPTYVPQVGGP
jgi:ABC-type phosphate transport system substrate-binding protein